MSAKLVVLELNEVPDRVIDSYIGANPDSHWATVARRGARFVAATAAAPRRVDAARGPESRAGGAPPAP